MWQQLILALAKPQNLSTLITVLGPSITRLVKQETSEEMAAVRQELGALTKVINQDLPVVLGTVTQRQLEQEQRLAALEEELRRTREALVVVMEALRRAQESGAVPRPSRHWPWS